MGISTYQSYCGAQIFDAIGLDQSVIDAYFTGTHSQIGGVKIDDIAKETIARHELAYNSPDILKITLDVGENMLKEPVEKIMLGAIIQ